MPLIIDIITDSWFQQLLLFLSANQSTNSLSNQRIIIESTLSHRLFFYSVSKVIYLQLLSFLCSAVSDIFLFVEPPSLSLLSYTVPFDRLNFTVHFVLQRIVSTTPFSFT